MRLIKSIYIYNNNNQNKNIFYDIYKISGTALFTEAFN